MRNKMVKTKRTVLLHLGFSRAQQINVAAMVVSHHTGETIDMWHKMAGNVDNK